jgi:glycosyltransferase involved in cell wall biosynthesis
MVIRSKKVITKSNTFASGLKLFYPAANYPHKNHKLLSHLYFTEKDVVEKITITIHESQRPITQCDFIECVGKLNPREMVKQYKSADALLFLSNAESYGFPLVEAMHLGLPIICPNLPYAYEMCGDEAVYFEVDCSKALMEAIVALKVKMMQGWRPDWESQLKKLPKSWDETAKQFLALCE